MDSNLAPTPPEEAAPSAATPPVPEPAPEYSAEAPPTSSGDFVPAIALPLRVTTTLASPPALNALELKALRNSANQLLTFVLQQGLPSDVQATVSALKAQVVTIASR